MMDLPSTTRSALGLAMLAAAGVTALLGARTAGAVAPVASTQSGVRQTAPATVPAADPPLTSLTDKIKANPKEYGTLASCLVDKGVDIQVGLPGAGQVMVLKGISRSVSASCS
ncbi:hypothetical protein [Streptomyces sp. NBC_00233]|uniref:hypothetical protein n=1 Tax=Streptomyces sp. NBC_00233 TaxID=2975686 RepID=UPI00224F498C|nr:hypothetical protein [Streptomyces sp. NBC_00233]MCX5233105.1 hypothetical protein [Streptomyces sp. NBC_00233]